jgi:hypothetical protein
MSMLTEIQKYKQNNDAGRNVSMQCAASLKYKQHGASNHMEY